MTPRSCATLLITSLLLGACSGSPSTPSGQPTPLGGTFLPATTGGVFVADASAIEIVVSDVNALCTYSTEHPNELADAQPDHKANASYLVFTFDIGSQPTLKTLPPGTYAASPLGGPTSDGTLTAYGRFLQIDGSCDRSSPEDGQASGTLTVLSSSEGSIVGSYSLRFPIAEEDGVAPKGFSMSGDFSVTSCAEPPRATTPACLP